MSPEFVSLLQQLELMQEELACHHRLEQYLRPHLRFDVEEVWAIALNSRLAPLAQELIFRGDASGCAVHPREIFRFALRHNAVFLAIAHSHPSGDAEPSLDDLRITQKLFMVSRLLQIPLVDHLVVSKTGMVSMAERGHFLLWGKKRSVRI